MPPSWFSRKLSASHSHYIVVLTGLFLASMIVDKGEAVLFINSHHSHFLDNFMRSATYFGDGIIFVFVIFALLFLRYGYSLAAVAVWIANGILVSLFKRILFPGFLRPHEYLDGRLLHFVPGVEVHGLYSFPSGHTATAFAAALLIAYASRNRLVGVFTLMLALLVGYSRIYLLQHFLMDVAGGAIVGCFSTYVIWQLMESRHRPKWMDGRLRLSTKRNQDSAPLDF